MKKINGRLMKKINGRLMKKINGRLMKTLMFKIQSAKRALMFIPVSSTNCSLLKFRFTKKSLPDSRLANFHYEKYQTFLTIIS
mgnify:CR=1 FL=1